MRRLFYIFVLLSSIAITGQELDHYRLKTIRAIPGLSALKNVESTTFQLQHIDLTVDIRAQSLRKRQGFTMRQNNAKRISAPPNISLKTPERKKGIRFSFETSDHNIPLSNSFGHGSTFYGRRYIPYRPRVN